MGDSLHALPLMLGWRRIFGILSLSLDFSSVQKSDPQDLILPTALSRTLHRDFPLPHAIPTATHLQIPHPLRSSHFIRVTASKTLRSSRPNRVELSLTTCTTFYRRRLSRPHRLAVCRQARICRPARGADDNPARQRGGGRRHKRLDGCGSHVRGRLS
jgi:hypothetical protein